MHQNVPDDEEDASASVNINQGGETETQNKDNSVAPSSESVHPSENGHANASSIASNLEETSPVQVITWVQQAFDDVTSRDNDTWKQN